MTKKQTQRADLTPAEKLRRDLIARKRRQRAERKKAGGSGGSVGGIKKPHRFRPGTVALREIRRYQRDGKPLLKRKPMYRLIKETMADFRGDLRLSNKALEGLMHESEEFLVGKFRAAQGAAIHAGRATIMPKDMQLAGELRAMEQNCGSVLRQGTNSQFCYVSAPAPVSTRSRPSAGSGAKTLKHAKKVTAKVFHAGKQSTPAPPVDEIGEMEEDDEIIGDEEEAEDEFDDVESMTTTS